MRDVSVNGKPVAPMSGTASVTDGVLALNGAWAIEEGKTLLPAAQGVDVTGRFGLHARLGPSVRDVRVSIDDGKIVAKDYDASFEGITAAVALESFSPLATPPSQHVTLKHATIGKLELADGALDVRVENPNAIFVEQTTFGWAGGRMFASAFRFDPLHPKVDLIVSGDDLDLNQVLAILSDGKASGAGRLYGRLPVRIEWPRFAFGDGFFVRGARQGADDAGRNGRRRVVDHGSVRPAV
jgi:hypothetical protein